MADKYVAYTWGINDPITKSKMNHIEEGIANISNQVDSTDTRIQGVSTDLAEKYRQIVYDFLGFQTSEYNNGTIAYRLQQLQTNIDNNGASALSAKLDAVVNQVNEARRQEGSDNPDQWHSLAETLAEMRTATAAADTKAGQAKATAEAARDLLNLAKGEASSVAARLDDIESYNTTQDSRIEVIEGKINKPVAAVEKSMTAFIKEIYDAHRDSNDTLDTRFDALEEDMSSAIGDEGDTLKTRISALRTEMNDAHISTANSNTTYQSLDERLEADERKINSAASEVTEAHRAGVTNDTLNNRFNDIETAIDHVQGEDDEIPNGLKQRMTTAESAIDTLEDTTIPGLDARLDAIDGGSAFDSTNGTLAQHMSAAESNISTIQSQISHAVAENDAGGLTERITAAETSIDNIESSIGSGFDSINTIAAAINTKANSSDVNTALAAKADASTTSTTIVKAKADVAYTEGVPSATQTWTINDKDDYLLQAADYKYYYWKHINNEWHLMGGAGNGEGGSGNTTGIDLTRAEYNALSANNKAENTDYYVRETSGLIRHYRYITVNDALTEIEIGQVLDTNNIKTYNMARIDTTRINSTTNEEEEVSYLNLYEFDYGTDNTVIDDESSSVHLRAQIELPKGGGGGGSASGSTNRLVRIGDQSIQRIAGSTILLQVFYSSYDTEGESSSGEYTLKTGNTIIESGIIASGAQGEVVSGWKNNTPGYKQFDVSNYCKIGTTNFTLAVIVNGTTIGKSWSVNIIDLHLETTAPDTLLINSTNSYAFPYTPFGALDKTLHVIIDNNTANVDTITLPASSSGRATNYNISAQAHGVHKIEMYLTATVGGIEQRTESIIREYIWYDADNTQTPVILASPYNNQTITAQQYTTIEIPYQVYKKDASIIDVYYYLDSSDTAFDHIQLEDSNTGKLSYLASASGAHSLQIKVDDQSININLSITALSINVAPINGAIIDFDPTTLENTSANRLPHWTVGQNQYSLVASDNFNWSNDNNGGGYKKEEDGKALVIKAGTYVDLTYPLFARVNNEDILTRGAELKIIYKTKAVRKADAVWLKSVDKMYNKDVGLQLGVHFGWLKTTRAVEENITIEPDENGVISMNGTTYNIWKPNTPYAVNDVVVLWDETDEDNHQIIFRCITAWDNTHTTFLNSKGKVDTASWLSIGKISTSVAATDSYLFLSYSEQDKIELDINVDAATQFIMSYEDGVPSKVYAYSTGTGGDGLYHNNTIRIGSDDCDVYLYGLRIYNNSLTTADILQNFIADGSDINEKVSRYNRNCIYWDPTQNGGNGAYFTSPSGTAALDPIKLAEVMPNVKILMLDTPVFTTSKKDFVINSTLRCIHADGGNIYTSRGDADNWLFTNGFHSGQGTTSDNYGQSARNVDFLFEVDGVHYPTKAKNMGTYTPSLDYISKVYVGKNASTWNELTSTWDPAREAEEIETCRNWKGDQCKISLTESSVPNNYFNLKVNVASSENVNNALFQKRYDDFLVYKAPSQTQQIAKHRLAYEQLGQSVNKIKVKNSMEFVPAVLFVRENNPDITKHVEFNDCNWHFYALGNIGDSKKTDYTRAYDPDDMNEFTCENSDNNTNNGQFQSGVFNYNGHEAIETDYSAWSSDGEYTQDDIVVNDGVIYRCSVSSATVGAWNSNQWTPVSYTNWTESGSTPYFAPRTNPNSMEYIFPIKPSQWNVQLNGEYLNRKHKTLIEEEFDGDHSFEFRYGCCGDYRDGDLINETEGQDDDAQFNLNHDVVLAFYEWVITSTPEQYQAEAPQWFIKSAMEFFYAYTHYYTMMDNRAKNTFWHFAKTGTYIEVSRPVKELLHVYEESIDNGTTWRKATGTEIDSNKKYRTQYAFDLWAYDMDTAAGIDNNGQLSFPYGKEDDDYRVDGVPTSGYAFNGAGSIFWRRLKTTFASEIAEVMNTAQDCFKPEELISEFDQFQNCFPEEIWRLDIERKYIRTFTGESIDDSITIGKKNPRFLTAMMQGRKKYQRRQWIRNQSLYFNSKYRLKDITVASNTTEFNVITPANANDPNIAVKPNYDLKLVPYQDMYINVTVGNGGPTPSRRVKAGETYILPIADYTSANFGETRIYIYGFTGISEVGNLASMYPYSFTLNALDHLKKLDMGTDASGYVNANLTSLPFTKDTELPLLEEINIKNCHSLSGGLNLNQANNLRVVEATGTTITGINLPQYTQIETLHLPSTVTDLVLYGAKKLDDLQIINNNTGLVDYSGLFNLNIYDSDYSSNIDWMNIASSIIEKQSLETNISLLHLSNATIVNIDSLEPFANFKSILEEQGNVLELSGTINVTGSWSTIEVSEYKSVWNNDIDFVTNPANMVTRYKITYKYDDYIDDNGNVVTGAEITTKYVRSGTRIPDIVYTNEIDPPTRASTVRYDFTFGVVNYDNYVENSGWKAVGSDTPFNEMPLASGNMTIETYFTPSTRRYPVKWYMRRNDDSTLVKTSSNQEEYGAGYDLEAPTVQEIHNAGQPTIDINVSNGVATYSIFEGWETLPTNIHPAATDTSYNIYAKWSTPVSLALSEIFADTTNLTPEQLLVYSHISSSDRSLYVDTTKIDEGKRITVTMGHDSSEEGTTLVASDSILRLDLNPRATKTNIQPMTAENDAFTIMIDYNLSANTNYDSSKTAAILMSCYYQNSNENIVSGFAIYDSLKGSAVGPRVGFGDMFSNTSYSVPIGGKSLYHDVRNVVVLRHPAGSEKLYVYSGLNTSNKITSNIEVQTITWNNSTNNAYINFGQLTDSTDPEYDNLKDNLTTARGIIYQAKYWNQDLGVGECKRLASWPHETITFGISKINNNASSGSPGDNNPSPSLCLNTLTGTNYGHLTEDTSSMSWGESTYRTILNTHVVQGLPIKLQAILNKPKVKYLPLVTTTDPMSQAQTTTLSDNTLSQNDYLFFPSIYNINSANSTYASETSNMSYEKSPYPWIRSSNVTVYDYNPTATNGHWDVSSDSETMRYMNLRFSIKPIGQTIRVFRETANSFSTGNTATIYNEILTVVSSIAVGDIFIDITGHAYMYIANTDINNLGAQVQPNSGIFACPASPGGGWISSSGFATRSMMTPDSWSTNNKHFIYSNESGTVVTAYSSNNSISGNIGLGLNYSFTI